MIEPGKYYKIEFKNHKKHICNVVGRVDSITHAKDIKIDEIDERFHFKGFFLSLVISAEMFSGVITAKDLISYEEIAKDQYELLLTNYLLSLMPIEQAIINLSSNL